MSRSCPGTLRDAPRKASRPPASPEAPPSGFSRRPRGDARASSLVRRDRAAPPVEAPPALRLGKPRPRKFVAAHAGAARGPRGGGRAGARDARLERAPRRVGNHAGQRGAQDHRGAREAPPAATPTPARRARPAHPPTSASLFACPRDRGIDLTLTSSLSLLPLTAARRHPRHGQTREQPRDRRRARGARDGRGGRARGRAASPRPRPRRSQGGRESRVAVRLRRRGGARGLRASREDFARAAAEHIAALADRELEHARAVRGRRRARGAGLPGRRGSPAPGSGARQPTLDGVVAALFAAGSAEAERAVEAEEAAAGGGGRGARAGAAGGRRRRPPSAPARARPISPRADATAARRRTRRRRRGGGRTRRRRGRGAGAPRDAAPRVRTPRASRSAPRAVTRGRG